MYKAAWSLLAFFILASCNSGGSGNGTGGAAGAGGAVGGASGAGGAGGAVGGSGGDAGVDAEGGGAVGGTGGTAGDAGPACNGPDLASCLIIVEADGSGACHEGSGFQGPQKAVFDQTCADSNGVLGTTPCSHAYPNAGGCSQPSTFCWVVWGLYPDDPSTSEDEFAIAKSEQPNACASIGGTYYAP